MVVTVAQQVQHYQRSARVETAYLQLHLTGIEAGFSTELARAGRGKITKSRRVWPLVHFELLHRFGYHKVKIGVALAVGVAHHIHRQPVHAHREIGAVVHVEAAQKNLFGLAAARVLGNEQARHQP